MVVNFVVSRPPRRSRGGSRFGRTEFLSPEGGDRWVADRAESLRDAYRQRLEAHRAGLAEIAHRLGWTFLVHHTDRSASEPLLTLIMHLSAGGYRWQSGAPAAGTSSDGIKTGGRP